MKLFFILGNQLFPPKYLDRFKNDHLFFMSEDHELCTYEKHHKLKVLLFLSAMRSHLDHLKKNRFKVEYSRIDSNDFKKDYNSYGGNAYGLANTLLQTAFLRPKIKSKKLKNLYFSGQLTVPGPGVPPAIVSGKLVSDLIVSNEKTL